MKRFRLNPKLVRWLRSGPVLEGEPADEGPAPDWDGWLLRRMSQGEIVAVGGILVDRAVLSQRFACVSDRCAPRPGRGKWRSCCADAAVVLDRDEARRIAKSRRALARELGLDSEGLVVDGALTRPGRRCVFSEIEQGSGRLRCRLFRFARKHGVDRMDVQPLSCRLFPLIVVDVGGATALTVVGRTTHRLVGSHPPGRYPCLSDPKLPPIWESLRGDLDWAFGKGFAAALRRVSKSE